MVDWDSVDEGYTDKRGEQPFWALPHDKADDDSQKSVHRWCQGELEHLQHINRDRFKRCEKNLTLYKGIQYRDQEVRGNVREKTDKVAQAVEKIVLNHLFDLTKSRVSKLIKYKPAVAILPTNDEFEDDYASKMTKAWLDHIWYCERFDGEQVPAWIRPTQTMGEAYMFVDWNPNKGDLSKQWRAAEAEAKKFHGQIARVPLLDESGKQQNDEAGNPIWIEKPVRNGDVEYRVKRTTDCLPERVYSGKWSDVRYIFEREVMGVHEARLKYPKAAEKIKADKDATIYDWERMEARQDKHQVEVWTLWYKRTDEMERGRKVVFTKDGILANTRFPFSHRKLPCVRLTDVDVDGELHGYSFFEFVKGATGAHNNLTNMILRNQIMCGHPKWMLPAGSAKIDSLGNAITVVQFKGPVAPQLVKAEPTPREVFEFRNMLQEDFMRLADVGKTSQGEPPPGVTAMIALQYLSEMENERWNESVLKYNEAILQLSIMTIGVGGDYYDRDDERMIRILGKNNAWMSVALDVAHLHKDYDVRIQSSSALPESKSARTAYLLDLNERFPDKVDSDSVLNMLDLAQSDKFVTAATVSVRAAEAENQMLLDPKSQTKPPTPEEDHLKHWPLHIRQMRDFGFKYNAPEPIQERVRDHVIATEKLIIDKCRENPAYLQAVMTVLVPQGFPALFKVDLRTLAQPLASPSSGVAPEQDLDAPPQEPDYQDPQAPIQEEGVPVNDEPPPIDSQLAAGDAAAIPNVEPTSSE
jgi:hypothetical protein